MIKLQILQLVIYFVVIIHWTACAFYAVVWVNKTLVLSQINEESADPSTYFIGDDGDRRPKFL